MGPHGFTSIITKFVGKELPFLEIRDANVTQRQKTLECSVMSRSQTNSNFLECEKRDRKAI